MGYLVKGALHYLQRDASINGACHKVKIKIKDLKITTESNGVITLEFESCDIIPKICI